MITKTTSETSEHELPISGNVAGNNPLISDAEAREQRIACIAYFIAEKRGFEPGYELEDWSEAEKIEVESI